MPTPSTRLLMAAVAALSLTAAIPSHAAPVPVTAEPLPRLHQVETPGHVRAASEDIPAKPRPDQQAPQGDELVRAGMSAAVSATVTVLVSVGLCAFTGFCMIPGL